MSADLKHNDLFRFWGTCGKCSKFSLFLKRPKIYSPDKDEKGLKLLPQFLCRACSKEIEGTVYGKCGRCLQNKYFLERHKVDIGNGVIATSRSYCCLNCVIIISKILEESKQDGDTN